MAEFVFIINENTCIECGQCRRYCPIPGAIVISAEYQHTVVADLCIGCGICEVFCPVPDTLSRVERPAAFAAQPMSLKAPPLEIQRSLRHVVWLKRWRYQRHPIMAPAAKQARDRLHGYLKQLRARHAPIAHISPIEDAQPPSA